MHAINCKVCADHEEKATEFESSKVEELLKQVDVNKIKGNV